ncbi:MAG TPA: DedA family protein [Pseudonocardia sp.]
MVLDLMHRIGEHVGGWLYLIAGFFAFAEAAIMIGMVLPGEAALLVAGFGAHQGWISLWPMVLVAVVAAIVGDSVGYEVGKHWGPALRESALGRRIGVKHWATTDAFLHRHGGKAVFLGRCTAVLRALIPGMAGMARLPYLRTFLPWNVVGGVLWGGGCVLLGYAFSASLEKISHAMTYGPMVVIGVLLVAWVALKLVRRRKERAAADEAPGTSPDQPAELS